MADRSHDSKRTVEDWVHWCHSEGFPDIADQDHNGKTVAGKVYCKLCPMWFVANKKTITRHCLGYKVKTDQGEKHVDTEHCKKVQKREQLEKERTQVASALAPPPPIIVQVCVYRLCISFLLFFGGRCKLLRLPLRCQMSLHQKGHVCLESWMALLPGEANKNSS